MADRAGIIGFEIIYSIYICRRNRFARRRRWLLLLRRIRHGRGHIAPTDFGGPMEDVAIIVLISFQHLAAVRAP